jgi:hypothetical protein
MNSTTKDAMDQPAQPQNPATKRIVFAMPGMEKVTVRHVEYRSTPAGPLTMDIYYPPDLQLDNRAPAVLFVTGYADQGARKVFGRSLKDMGSYVSWAQLMAASGLVAITYDNQEPSSDLHSVIEHIHGNAAALAIAEDRLGIWASSGNVPNAFSLLMDDSRWRVRCAALCYGFTLDVDGFDDVARAAGEWGFANPCAGKSVDDLRRDLPLLIVRAGRDEIPRLNQALDRILPKAFGCNLPLTIVNLPEAPHAFDVIDDNELSREVIRQIIAFMRFHLMS